MAQIVGLPKLSPTMEEGVLAKWTKKEGDTVSPGDTIAEVETDKANMDFTLEDSGTLLKLLVKEGDTVKLGAPVAILGKPGDAIDALIAEAQQQMGGGAAPAPAAKADAAPAKAEAKGDTPPAKADAKTGAAPAKTESKMSTGETRAADGDDVEEGEADESEEQAQVAGAEPVDAKRTAKTAAANGPAAQRKPQASAAPARPAPRAAPTSTPVPTTTAQSVTPILASPLAKTLAAENGIDLRGVMGSGPGGRVVERDVQAILDNPPAAAPDAQGSTALVPSSSARGMVPAVDGSDFTDTALSPMRKTIARRLVEAKSTIPHFYLTTHVDAAPLRRFREELNGVIPEDEKISVNDLLIKAVALALVRFPAVNSAFVGDAIRHFHRVHVGVAVSIDDGLLTPVVFDADVLSLRGIRATIRDLAARAKIKKLKPEEMTGSTFTVSNLGMFGIDHFEAIINPPESCILAIGRTQKVPVVDPKTGAIVAGERMGMTLSCDHRVVDGALGAKFMGVLTELIEHPASLAL